MISLLTPPHLYVTKHPLHLGHRCLGDVSPIHASAVHEHDQPVERALRDHDVLQQHEQVPTTRYEFVLLRVGIFEICHHDAIFFASGGVQHHGNGPVKKRK